MALPIRPIKIVPHRQSLPPLAEVKMTLCNLRGTIWRYTLLAVGVAIIHGIIYFILFDVWFFGHFRGSVWAVIAEVMLLIIGVPLMALITCVSILVPSVAEFMRTAQEWCGGNSLYICAVACNSLFWGITISCLIYRHKHVIGRGSTGSE